ncbi:MAG: cation transporter [Ruminococcaceae bacterium]|nr:cation transporter [Oscillospiraceae bacterium]
MVLNALMAVIKIAVGAVSGSGALVSDGVHSVTDVFSSLVVLIGIKLSGRSSDRRHPYGHERMECVAAVLLSVLVGATGIGIGTAGLRAIAVTQEVVPQPPGWRALTVAVISVVIKEMMFRYTHRAAKQVNSGALMADAWHLRSDALSSVGGLVGILGANLGVAVMDPLAAVVISLFILKAAIGIFADAMRKMTDRSCDEAFEKAVSECVCRHWQVRGIRELKTRLFGSRVYVEVTAQVDGALSCREAFAVARTVEETVRAEFADVKDCAVHIYPL